MKQLCTLIIGLFIISCAPENELKVSGNIDGLKKGTVILQKLVDTSLISVDSVQIDGNPDFVLSTTVESPEMYYLYLRLKNGDLLDERIPFFAEEGEMSIQTSLKKFGNEYTIEGSENQKKLEEYIVLMQRYADKNIELISKKLDAMSNRNDSLYSHFEEEEDKLLKRKYLASVNYALSENQYEIAPYIMVYEVDGIHQKYLDTVYNSLTQKIKTSKYGKDLEALRTSKRTN